MTDKNNINPYLYVIDIAFTWFFTPLSILSLIHKYYILTTNDFIIYVVEEYDSFLKGIFDKISDPIIFIIDIIQQYISIGISLNDNWRHATVIILFYLAPDIIKTRWRGREASFWLLLILALLIVLANAVKFEGNTFHVFYIAMFCFVVFDLVQSVIDATLYPGERSKLNVFYYYTGVMTIPSFFIFLLCVNIINIFPSIDNELFPFLIFILLIMARNISIGMYHGIAFRSKGQSIRERFNQSNTGKLGIHLCKAMGAVAFIVYFL